MSNSFNISVKPEIAAAVVKIDANKTEIDSIRGTDVVNIQTNINANETKIDENKAVVDAIRGTDVVNIQSNINDNETKIDANKIVSDAIQAKTDLLPQNFRGKLYFSRIVTANASFQDVVNIAAGSGNVYAITMVTVNAADQVNVHVSIDGKTIGDITHTGDGNQQSVLNQTLCTATIFTCSKTPLVTGYNTQLWTLEFKESLLIQVKRGAGTTGFVECAASYSLD